MGLGWVSLALSAVSAGISLWQGNKAKKKQKAAEEAARKKAYEEEQYRNWVQQNTNITALIQVMQENEVEEAKQARLQKYIKIGCYTIAGVSTFFLVRSLQKNKENKKNKSKKK